jgi:hypothetical protein
VKFKSATMTTTNISVMFGTTIWEEFTAFCDDICRLENVDRFLAYQSNHKIQ